MLNNRAIKNPKPREPFSTMLVIIACGTTVTAFSISSLMCHAPSKPARYVRDGNFERWGQDSPVNGNALVRRPTHHDTPLLLHPPRFSKSVNTQVAECWGAKHTIGINRRNQRPM